MNTRILYLIVAAFLTNSWILKYAGGQEVIPEERSLDSYTPGLSFLTLPPSEVEVSNLNLATTLEIQELRSDENYELPVVLKNLTNQPLTPVNAITSCKCLVGSIKNQIIKVGELGVITLRFRTTQSDLNQTVKIEFSNGMRFALHVQANIKLDFLTSKQMKSLFVEDLEGEIPIEIEFQSQRDDIEFTTLSATAMREMLLVESLRSDGRTVWITLKKGSVDGILPSDETIELKYQINSDKSRYRHQEFRIKLASRAVVVRPRIFKLSANRDLDRPGPVELAGKIRIHNLPSDQLLMPGAALQINLVKHDKLLLGKITSCELGQSGAVCNFVIEIAASDFDAFIESKEWQTVEFRCGELEVVGLKCFFENGDQ